MYTYMYRFLELFEIICQSLAFADLHMNVVYAVEHHENPFLIHKKSPFVIIWQRAKLMGDTGLEPVTSCL